MCVAVASVTGWGLNELLNLNAEQLQQWTNSVVDFQQLKSKSAQ